MASKLRNNDIATIVGNTIKPMMMKLKIPGMAVAVTMNGKSYFFNYGVMSKKTKEPVTSRTLFEIGSVSKTFTATLLSSLVSSHKLKLSGFVGQYMPQLQKSALGKANLMQLASHTSGLPLSAPSNIKTPKQFFHYLQSWQPLYPIGTQRVYSNIGLGLLGILMAQTTGETYQALLTNRILRPLGLKNTYVAVPTKAYARYAEGYTRNNQPIRIPNKVPLPAAYGIRSCSHDLIRYVQANIDSINSPITKLQKAIYNTHIRYYRTPYFGQALVWEQYSYPVSLKRLLLGNGRSALNTSAKYSTLKTKSNIWVNKTGSTEGFATYIAYVPRKKIGVVLLANKYYPNEQRVQAAYGILSQLTNSANHKKETVTTGHALKQTNFLKFSKINEAKKLSLGKGTKVAVLGWLFDMSKPASTKYINQISLVPNQPLGEFKPWHGSWMVNIVHRIASKAKIIPIRVRPKTTTENFQNNTEKLQKYIIKGIIYAADHGAVAVTNSTGPVKNSQELINAVKYAESKGCIFVDVHPEYQGWKDGHVVFADKNKLSKLIIHAGLVTSAKHPVKPDMKRDICTWGYQINPQYKDGWGYSSSPPIVGGVIALMKGVNQNLTPKQIRNIIYTTAMHVNGFKVLNAEAAVKRAIELNNCGKNRKKGETR